MMKFFNTIQDLLFKYILIVVIYFVVFNLIAFIMYGVDKKKAIKHKWRIPEHDLILVAVLGGSIGALLGMKAFRHKTKHTKFVIGVPAILVVQLILLVLIAIAQ